ncbi:MULTISPECIES: homoserine dehydrogenase [Rummeliibacillus]|uniref:homoserine dehydrogenase n=1 Tax=Rummeliibacillus TaxID=648802 RepID=UPI0011B5CD71|nr:MULTISPECIES: homoserine dehydrogenase [Rummeliibacillus]MBO2537246.1 homoserine dehydrogenase [Rummeliibacillus suwonensis]
MTTVKVAILGFGTVGQGIFHIVNEKREQFKHTLGVDIEIAKILVNNVNKPRPHAPKELLTDNFEDILAIPDLEVVFEAIVGEEPAFRYLSKAIEKGCNIITANKVMFSRYGLALQKKAKKYGVQVGYEATVAGGVPVIKTMQNILRVNEVSHIQGILNGTSNYILTQMRSEGLPFDKALRDAQDLGYAEADPYNDISGQDPFRKLMILSALAFGEQPNWDDVDVVGITGITAKQVAEAKAKGLRYRHIGDVRRDKVTGKIVATVGPQLVGPEHPLYNIEGVNNAVALDTNYIGTLTLVGPGAGMFPTASVMVEDYADMLVKTPAVVSI